MLETCDRIFLEQTVGSCSCGRLQRGHWGDEIAGSGDMAQGMTTRLDSYKGAMMYSPQVLVAQSKPGEHTHIGTSLRKNPNHANIHTGGMK